MSRQEARRRLQEADPNLKIVSGRKSAAVKILPKVLSPKEAAWLGLPEMIPMFPPDEIIAIEAKWSKPDLKLMAFRAGLDTRGDKELLVVKLVYAGVLDLEGRLTNKYIGIAPRVLPQTKKPSERMPRIDPHASAIKQDKQYREQQKWLKAHGFRTAREAQEAGY